MILVTGQTGFIGSHLKERLIKEGHQVADFFHDIRYTINIPKEVDTIYHLAAMNSPYQSRIDPYETAKTNVCGTLNLLNIIKNTSHVKKVIFTSSIYVYKNLSKTKETDEIGYNGTPYGYEKLIGEEYLKIYSKLCGFDYVILRLSSVYGNGMKKGHIFDITQGLINNEKIKLYVNRHSVYNFVYVDDVINALISSLKWKNEIVNIHSGKHFSLEDIYKIMSKIMNRDVDIEDTEQILFFMGSYQKAMKLGRFGWSGWREKYSLENGLKEYLYLLKKDERKN